MSNQSTELPLAVAITGASGVAYGQRLIEVLLAANVDVHLTISDSAKIVAKHELDLDIDLNDFKITQLLPQYTGDRDVTYHHYKDFMTPIARQFENRMRGRSHDLAGVARFLSVDKNSPGFSRLCGQPDCRPRWCGCRFGQTLGRVIGTDYFYEAKYSNLEWTRVLPSNHSRLFTFIRGLKKHLRHHTT